MRILNAIREGEVSLSDLAELKRMTTQNWSHITDGILPTKLHTHRDKCDQDTAQVGAGIV